MAAEMGGARRDVPVGIIANPASGKDIRRLVAYGTVFDNQEKVNIVRRILLALDALGIERVLAMPDYYGIVRRAAEGVRSDRPLRLAVEMLDMPLTGTQIDSQRAAEILCAAGCGCIVTLGGDGTNRMVAKGCREIPLMPVSTGTNNVFPLLIEGTTAGLAAGVTAIGCGDECTVRRSKKLTIFKNGEEADIALIDAVVLQSRFIGSRAMWEVENMRCCMVTRGEPHNIGVASVVGNLSPITPEDPHGGFLRFDASRSDIFAPIAPGLFLPVGVDSFRNIEPGTEVPVLPVPSIIALDGEREVDLHEGDSASIRLDRDGPRVVDVPAALKWATGAGFFQDRDCLRRLARL